MDKRIKKSSYLILALVLCLCSVTAFASTSSASINIGTESSTGSARTLADNEYLNGKVKSTNREADAPNLVGQMYTRGSHYTHLRSTASVYSGSTNFASYQCDDPQGGTFWVKLIGYNKQEGKASVHN